MLQLRAYWEHGAIPSEGQAFCDHGCLVVLRYSSGFLVPEKGEKEVHLRQLLQSYRPYSRLEFTCPWLTGRSATQRLLVVPTNLKGIS